MSIATADLLQRLASGVPGARFTSPRDGRLLGEVSSADLPDAVAAVLAIPASRFVTLAATDNGLEIELLYTLACGRVVVGLRVRLPKDATAIPSITGQAPAAEMIEKEVSELFGVTFAGHPRAEALVLPEDWPADRRPFRRPVAGPVMAQARPGVENLLRGGAALRTSPAMLGRRARVAVPEQPALACSDPVALKAFHDLIVALQFDRRAGYDWASGRLKYK